MDICLSPARAAASRRNGAKSRGPKTLEGKARSAQNALKHGLRARKWVVLHGENAAEFARLEAALIEELAPQGVLQSLLAQRVAAAVWRLGRAEQLETQLFAENGTGRSFGLALIRDCNGPRGLETLLRYRGGTLAEFWRALRTLKALQAEAADRPEPVAPAPRRLADRRETPIEPKRRGNPGDSARPGHRVDPTKADPRPVHGLPAAGAATSFPPIEPQREPCAAALLAGTALVPLGRRSWP